MDLEIAGFRSFLGEDGVRTTGLEPYASDWTGVRHALPRAVLLPRTPAEVAAAVTYASERGIGMIPSGGRTGLAGGAVVTASDQVVISLERLNRIEEVSPADMCLVAEAGVTTQRLQEAAAAAGCRFPIDLAAKGSSQIGGNVATNAGGLTYVRFGGTREGVLGLEVVLPGGQVLDMVQRNRKNNTGLDLKQLFVGSEGILGIITRVCVAMVPAAMAPQTLLLALPSAQAVIEVLVAVRRSGVVLTAFEFFSAAAAQRVLAVHRELELPLGEAAPYYVIAELDLADALRETSLVAPLEGWLASGQVIDAYLAASGEESRQIWAVRERITETLAQTCQVYKNDISVPISRIPAFEARLDALPCGDIALLRFGHVADGNIHLNYCARPDVSGFVTACHQLQQQIYPIVSELGGSVSAEHGIGLLKKNDLPHSRSKPELELMAKIKTLLDPHHIMNPGKVLTITGQGDALKLNEVPKYF